MEKGWKDKLIPLTTRQSVTCYDTEGATEQMYTFAMYGLGLKTLDDFDKPENTYTITEISDIAVAVIEVSEKGRNPTSEG